MGRGEANSSKTMPGDRVRVAPRGKRSGTLVGQVAVRIAVGAAIVVLALSALGYRLAFERFERQELARLEDYVGEKGRTESRLFRTAEEEVEALRELFLRHYTRGAAEATDEFGRFFRRGPEGAWRTVPELHDGVMTEDGEWFQGVSGFIGNDQRELGEDLRRRLVIALRLIAQLGPATDPALSLHASFPENAVIIHSDDPWGLMARADLDMTAGSVIRSTLRSENPEREPVWSDLYYDLTAETWTLTYQVPVDLERRHLITPSHDLHLSGLIERVIEPGLEGTTTMILTADGALVAHPERLAAVQQGKGQLRLDELDDPGLVALYERLRASGPIEQGSVTLLDSPVNDAHVAVTRLHGPAWWWVTLYPKERVAASAHDAARLIFLLGLGLFVLVVAVAYWVLRRTVAQPVATLTTASAAIGQGDYAAVADGALPLPEDQRNEIGLLARTVRRMARNLRDAHEQDDATFVLDSEGRLQAANPAAVRMTGYPSDDLLVKDIFDLGATTDHEALRKALVSLRPGDSERLTVRLHRRDGSSVPVEVSLRAFDTPEGLRITATARDITERIREEEQRLNLERRMLEMQRAESLGLLAGGVAHDFNNILVAILGNAELALEEVDPSSPLDPMLQEISAAASRAAALAKQMLAYSGRGHFQIEQLSLSDIARQAVDMVRLSVPPPVELRLDLDEELPRVAADPAQMQQIVTNLLINAWEAIGGDDGEVIVTTSLRAYSRDELEENLTGETVEPDSYVTLEVTDTGAGFDDELATRLVEPFYTTKFTGRGLGLAAVLGIVRGHGGAFLASGRPGGGARFRVLLPPASEQAEASPQSERPADGDTGRVGTVLVVDDEPVVRRVAAKLLETLGFETLEAVDGPEAVRLYRRSAEPIDAVLLDLSMPGMDGVEVSRELHGIDPDVRVWLTSGYSEREVLAKLEEFPVAGFIQKPFSLEDLRRLRRGGAR